MSKRKATIPVQQGGDDKVGPGHPPKEHQFKPGQSGNPKGSPKPRTNLYRHVAKYANMTDQELTEIARNDLTQSEKAALTERGLQQIWKTAIKRAGLPKELSIHSARHTIAVQLLKKTGNLRQVQKQLGHSSPATTANMYADISFEDMQGGLNGLYD